MGDWKSPLLASLLFRLEFWLYGRGEAGEGRRCSRAGKDGLYGFAAPELVELFLVEAQQGPGAGTHVVVEDGDGEEFLLGFISASPLQDDAELARQGFLGFVPDVTEDQAEVLARGDGVAALQQLETGLVVVETGNVDGFGEAVPDPDRTSLASVQKVDLDLLGKHVQGTGFRPARSRRGCRRQGPF